jgi:hypothetical protein
MLDELTYELGPARSGMAYVIQRADGDGYVDMSDHVYSDRATVLAMYRALDRINFCGYRIDIRDSEYRYMADIGGVLFVIGRGQ